MSKLMIVSYPLGSTTGEKAVIYQNDSDNKINQLLFDALHVHFKSDIPIELPDEGEVLNINLLEERKDRPLPSIQHFSLLGPHDMALLDAIEVIHEDLDRILQRADLNRAEDYTDTLQKLTERLNQSS